MLAFTSRPPASRDFKLCDQIRDAAASSTSNITEGFGRRRPAEFARFLEYATGSLAETKDRLVDAHDRGYIDDRLYWRLMHLQEVAARTTSRLLTVKREQAAAERRACQPRRSSISSR